MPKKYPVLSLKEFEEILNTFDIVHKRTKGGHVILTISMENKKVTVVYQTHIDPVPLKVIKNTIKALGLSVKDFYCRTKRGCKKLRS